MKLTLLTLLMSVVLTSCNTFYYDNEQAQAQPNNQQQSESIESSIQFHQQYNGALANKFAADNPEKEPSEDEILMIEQAAQQADENHINQDINYYVRGLMQDLVSNLQYVNATTPLAVVSFVMLDSNYNQANLLGIQIAESLIHEVHKFGIPVIDFKTTGFIRVTEQGDFAFSKDYQDFSGEMPARYIVGGTMLKNTDGYLINARIIGVKSQAVVASAQSFIPNNVAEPILTMTKQKSEEMNYQASSTDSKVNNLKSNNISLIQE